jgi:glycogen debranching enzyme
VTSPYDGTRPVAPLTDAGGVVTLVEGRSFAISGRTGDIAPDLPHGVFVLDRRALSRWELRIDRHAVEPVAVDLHEPFAATFVGRARPREGQADADIVVFRHRTVGAHTHEHISITNHGIEEVTLIVDLVCAVDLADLFDVKQGHVRATVGRAHERTRDRLVHAVEADDGLERMVRLRFDPPAIAVDQETHTWAPTIAPGGTWDLTADLAVSIGGLVLHDDVGHQTGQVPERRSSLWRASLPTLETGHPALAHAVERSGADLGSLLLSDPTHPEDIVPAAGAPWFMTLFGRDSLLTGWMTLLFDRTVARGALRALARLQGTRFDHRTEEEPGKILHEVRYGRAGGHGLGHGDVYYGSVDATPLFVVLLAELARWDDDDTAIQLLAPHADRALDWIGTTSDRHDGYLTYQCLDPRGLANQGWKDSWDAVRHPDGRLAEGPIALCEVQGYVYAAHRARAALAELFGDDATRRDHEARADALRDRFDRDFWMPEEGTYALALDGSGRQVAAVASNAGHCLWSGIVPEGRAPAVAERLMADDMWSGWGVRTLSTSMRAFNPVSYHNGSVWPHDNALCAAGMARYGLVDAAHRIIEAQLEVADIHDGRLPELFTGFDRARVRQPAAYPTSCSPQAWAAAAPLLWLRTLLGLDATVGPIADARPVAAPPWLGDIRLSGVRSRGELLTLTSAHE